MMVVKVAPQVTRFVSLATRAKTQPALVRLLDEVEREQVSVQPLVKGEKAAPDVAPATKIVRFNYD